ncbi:TNT domain-containing protein [Frondihabitans australicus]|uniref:TNT domain-containing protein n=1 Tax=Frondihabitans australicus TaxID=386892 RepID=UPI0011C38C8A|nr:TNT domain-containing protein [Frondihabitans australicus]
MANFVGDLWPDGDTGALRRSASAWHSLADELAAVHGGDVPRILQALDTTRTPELPAIRSTVERVASGASALAESASALATGCRDLADRIEHVHRQAEGVLQELLEQVGATALVGVGLTIVTAGLSDAAAGLAAGGEVAAAVARILGFIADFGAEASRLVGTVAGSAGRIAEAARLSSTVTVRIVTIVGDTVVTGAGGAATNVGVSLVTDPGGDLESAAVDGFVGGAALGAVGTSVGMAAAARAAFKKLSALRAEMQTWSSAAPASYSLFGPLSEEEWFAKYFAGFSDDGFPEWTWPAHDGFVPGTAKPNTLRAGDVIERISPVGRDGSFATTPGASFEALSLPPDRLSPAFVTTRYRVVLPLGKDVLEGPIAPHFEQPGMAKQYFFPKRMQVLVNAGYLKEVP